MHKAGKKYIFDNTVLSNFLLVNQIELLKSLYQECAWTSIQVVDELTRGIDEGYAYLKIAEKHLTTIAPEGWLSILNLETPQENRFYLRFRQSLDPGEAACLSLAITRQMVLATDDKAGRKLGLRYKVNLTGTIGILVRGIREECLTLSTGNQLLKEMIRYGYYSPVKSLDESLINEYFSDID